MRSDEIRPTALFDEYLRLTTEDARQMSHADFVQVPCPGCGGLDCQNRFSKHGFQYVLCQCCGSLFCSPRPHPKQLEEFYASSASAKFWATTFMPSVLEKRKKLMFAKKAKRIFELLNDHDLQPASVCDVGSGQGLLLQALAPFLPSTTLHAIEPHASLAAQCEEQGIETLHAPLEDAGSWNDRFDLVLSSEVIEHVFSPDDFVSRLKLLLKPGGACLMTGLGYEGFDILTLQEHSTSVAPPHHLNFLSVNGFEKLLARNDLKPLDISTPGELDVDLVQNASLENEFTRVLYSRGEDMVQRFQQFLRDNRLSSHVWALGRRETCA